LSVLTRQAN